MSTNGQGRRAEAVVNGMRSPGRPEWHEWAGEVYLWLQAVDRDRHRVRTAMDAIGSILEQLAAVMTAAQPSAVLASHLVSAVAGLAHDMIPVEDDIRLPAPPPDWPRPPAIDE